jgi:predicted N-acetyltransferase YhbS
VPLRVELMSDHPELVPVVSAWHFGEWGHEDPGGTPDSWAASLRERALRDRIPAVFVAFEGSLPIGSSALVSADMKTHPELSPWLINVFVLPEYRGTGVGGAVVDHACGFASGLGTEAVYLYTQGSGALYRRLGWSVLASESYGGAPVTVMSKRITA